MKLMIMFMKIAAVIESEEKYSIVCDGEEKKGTTFRNGSANQNNSRDNNQEGNKAPTFLSFHGRRAPGPSLIRALLTISIRGLLLCSAVPRGGDVASLRLGFEQGRGRRCSGLGFSRRYWVRWRK
ncbi:hypothetical protein CCACVL1_06351 [Corchorus capsularis]|uniref:Uncharacterized protein n=1 Tax=Corchorus capsularis TaxID=210143 RepID=A0A1R3JG24_COCAP|nr:hypothetical protein CCACVL1_06351 [Corchorus capsularis]